MIKFEDTEPSFNVKKEPAAAPAAAQTAPKSIVPPPLGLTPASAPKAPIPGMVPPAAPESVAASAIPRPTGNSSQVPPAPARGMAPPPIFNSQSGVSGIFAGPASQSAPQKSVNIPPPQPQPQPARAIPEGRMVGEGAPAAPVPPVISGTSPAQSQPFQRPPVQPQPPAPEVAPASQTAGAAPASPAYVPPPPAGAPGVSNAPANPANSVASVPPAAPAQVSQTPAPKVEFPQEPKFTPPAQDPKPAGTPAVQGTPSPSQAVKNPFKNREMHVESSPEKSQRRKDRASLKYRFIGALMILTAVAVVLPFVFDSEPPAPSISIPLTIPSENGNDVAMIPVAGAPVQEAEPKQNTVKKEEPAAEEKDSEPMPPAKSPEEEEKEKAEAEALKAAQAKAAAEAQKAEEAKIAAARKADAAKRAEEERKAAEAKKAAEKKEAEAKALADAKKAQEAAKQTALANKGSYYVQLIATSDPKKVASLTQTAKDNGLPVYTEQVTIQTGKITRVRVGPFKTIKEAENARAQLALNGLKTSMPQQIK